MHIFFYIVCSQEAVNLSIFKVLSRAMFTHYKLNIIYFFLMLASKENKSNTLIVLLDRQ